VKVTQTFSDGSQKTQSFNSRSAGDMARAASTVMRAVGQMMNGGNTAQSSGGMGRSDGSRSGVPGITGAPSKNDVLSVTQHSNASFADDGTPTFTPSEAPGALVDGLQDAYSSSVGRKVFNHLQRTGDKLHFAPGEDGGFEYNPDHDVIFYGDVAAFRRSSTVPGDGAASATMGGLLLHEIGHSPQGAAALGQVPIPLHYVESQINGTVILGTPLRDFFSEEYRAIRYYENPYRLERGLPLRRSYFEENDIMKQTLYDLWRGQ
jgi:hypothetical protein